MQWVRFLVMWILLCGLIGLLHVWCDLQRILADLYEMKAVQEDEKERQNNQPNGQRIQPTGQCDNPAGLNVKLRRKAFLLRRNADKLDNLLLKPLRRLGLLLRNKCMKAGTLIRMVSVNVRRADGFTGCVSRQINNESLDVTIHKTQTMPNGSTERCG